MPLRFSQLENMSVGRLKSLITKQYRRKSRLNSILQNAKDFNIPLSPITESAIQEKVSYYQDEQAKLWWFLQWKRGKGGKPMWVK